MKSLPFILVYSRILLGILIGVLSYFKIASYSIWIPSLMLIGLLTDVFDGIIARKYDVATKNLRVWDSNVDTFFWSIVIISIFYLNTTFFMNFRFPIFFVIILQISNYLLSYFRFQKPIATHSILAKIWTLSLLIFLIDLCINSEAYWSFILCIFLGIISRIEIALIILKLKKWTTDVPSIFVVDNINRGIEFKKISLFN